jgi:hypothetical protein
MSRKFAFHYNRTRKAGTLHKDLYTFNNTLWLYPASLCYSCRWGLQNGYAMSTLILFWLSQGFETTGDVNITLLSLQPLFQGRINNYHIFWVCICSLRYSECSTHASYCYPYVCYAARSSSVFGERIGKVVMVVAVLFRTFSAPSVSPSLRQSVLVWPHNNDVRELHGSRVAEECRIV